MHADEFLQETVAIAVNLDRDVIEKMAEEMAEVREKRGRLFVVGLGGSAANASHATADLRKLCKIDARCFDNMAELTARANDEGWKGVFVDWLESQGAGIQDGLLVLSVGGGTEEVSVPITRALGYAVMNGMSIMGITGPDGGYTHQIGNAVLRVPSPNPKHVTPHAEAFQAVVWHLLVSHPLLQKVKTKW